MANDKHITLLKQGVSAWNAWRDENPDIRPDLSRLTLNGANLSEANLNLVNLETVLNQRSPQLRREMRLLERNSPIPAVGSTLAQIGYGHGYWA